MSKNKQRVTETISQKDVGILTLSPDAINLPPQHFTPLVDFWSEELHSQYVKGLTYTIRSQDSVLANLVTRWLAEDKVALVGNVRAAAAPAALSGTGHIK